jgi:hypothetical protein
VPGHRRGSRQGLPVHDQAQHGPLLGCASRGHSREGGAWRPRSRCSRLRSNWRSTPTRRPAHIANADGPALLASGSRPSANRRALARRPERARVDAASRRSLSKEQRRRVCRAHLHVSRVPHRARQASTAGHTRLHWPARSWEYERGASP